jgi:hypothetical protein
MEDITFIWEALPVGDSKQAVSLRRALMGELAVITIKFVAFNLAFFLLDILLRDVV